MKCSSPEATGISSAAVAAFFRRLADMEYNLHGVAVLRDGALVAEGYTPPHHKDKLHLMYSQSKSLTSLAVGFLIDEGKLALDSKIADFFPEFVTEHTHPWLLETTVRHMLMMTDPHSFTTYAPEQGPVLASGWAKSWFDIPPSHRPGRVFHYNTSCTYMLDVVIEKLAGMPFMDYLRPRLLDPIGVSKNAFCGAGPDGYSAGGSSVCCTARDMALVGQFCLQLGEWEGKQLLSADYLKAATSRQIDNTFNDDLHGDVETHQGYGYQMWQIRHGGFLFFGLHTQLTICLPCQNLVVAITGDTPCETAVPRLLDAVYTHLLPACGDVPLPEGAAALADLRALTEALPAGRFARGNMTQSMAARTYRFGNNETGVSVLTFAADDKHITIQIDGEFPPRSFIAGLGHYHDQRAGETFLFNGRGQYGHMALQAAATWADARTLLLDLREGGERIVRKGVTIAFDGDEVTLFVSQGGGAVIPGLRAGMATGKQV